MYVFVVVTKEGVALRKREEGLLKGMYEFLTCPMDKGVDEALKGLGVEGAKIVKKEKAVHIFTHVKWEMECVLVYAKSTPFEHFSIAKIEEEISLPTAFAKGKQLMREAVCLD